MLRCLLLAHIVTMQLVYSDSPSQCTLNKAHIKAHVESFSRSKSNDLPTKIFISNKNAIVDAPTKQRVCLFEYIYNAFFNGLLVDDDKVNEVVEAIKLVPINSCFISEIGVVSIKINPELFLEPDSVQKLLEETIKDAISFDLNNPKKALPNAINPLIAESMFKWSTLVYKQLKRQYYRIRFFVDPELSDEDKGMKSFVIDYCLCKLLSGAKLRSGIKKTIFCVLNFSCFNDVIDDMLEVGCNILEKEGRKIKILGPYSEIINKFSINETIELPKLCTLPFVGDFYYALVTQKSYLTIGSFFWLMFIVSMSSIACIVYKPKFVPKRVIVYLKPFLSAFTIIGAAALACAISYTIYCRQNNN